MKLFIVCAALAVAAVSAYPGGHAESYANQKLWSGDHHGGYGGEHGGYGGEHGGYIISGYNAGHDDHDDGHQHYAPTPYKYEYGVKDFHTGDNKEAWEHSDGHGNVKGMYSLYEPDGTKRIVEYTADPHAGFNAKVTRVGHAVHPEHHEQHHEQHHW